MRIAILGASGHVGKSLLHEFSNNKDLLVHAYARSYEKIQNDQRLPTRAGEYVFPIDQFPRGEYDAVINCIGMGDTRDIRSHPSQLFVLTEKYDNIILSYLRENPACSAVYISSGAVYGSEFATPAHEDSTVSYSLNHVDPKIFYAMTKMYSEIKHRANADLSIIDIRLFAYFSAYIDLSTSYFMADIVNALKSGTTFSTNRSDFIRDYIHPSDFAKLVLCCIKKRSNVALDAYSKKPISKYEIIDELGREHDLTVQYQEGFTSVTGDKNQYYSTFNKAESIGYTPEYTSAETIREVVEKILRG